MADEKEELRRYEHARIDVEYEYAVCAWARHFNVSELRVKEAVAAVGNHADKVMKHLGATPQRRANPERPSGY